MSTTIERAPESLLVRFAPSELGLVGQVAASWGISGGLVAAGVVALHTTLGSISASVGFLTATLFFLAGSLIGFLHGGLLAYLGRPAGVSRAGAIRQVVLGLLYGVPTLALGWLVAMLLVASAVAIVSGRTLTLAASAIGWVALVGILWWTAVATSRAFRHLVQRWPGSRPLLVTLALAFLALLPVFLVTRPQIWIVGARPTATTAAIMALAATAWILGPLGTLILLAYRTWRPQEPDVPYRDGRIDGDG